MDDFTVAIVVGAGDYAFTLTAELGGDGTTVPEATTVVLRFRWLELYTVWSVRLETPTGDELSLHAMAREGGEVAWDSTNAGAPLGRLMWVGRDTKVRSDLGTRLKLMWREP